MRERFTRPVPTNAFELLEYCYDFNEYFIELCDWILEDLQPDNECRNSWETKKQQLKVEQRGWLDEQWFMLQDQDIDMCEEEKNTKLDENISRVNTLDRELEAVIINNIQEELRDLVNIVHLCYRKRYDRRELWLGIHFGSKCLEFKIDQSYSYTFCVRQSNLIVDLSNVEIIIDSNDRWQIGTDDSWELELPCEINERNQAIWKFINNTNTRYNTRYNYFRGQCRSKKIGTLNLVNSHLNTDRNIRCSLELREPLHIESLYINQEDVQFNNKQLWTTYYRNPERERERQKYIDTFYRELNSRYNFSQNFIPIEAEVKING
jgi:hypothetical protein